MHLMRQDALKRIATTAESIAASSGAKAKVRFGPVAYPVTTNPAATDTRTAISGGNNSAAAQ